MYLVLKSQGKPQDFAPAKISQKSIKKTLTSSNPGAILHVTRKKPGWIEPVEKVFFTLRNEKKSLTWSFLCAILNKLPP